jgi:cephalosporin hydroxylase
MGNDHPKGSEMLPGNRSLEATSNYLLHAEMFIGVGSGLSWLSWALNVPTVIISGFSAPHTEPTDSNVLRIFNHNIGCTGCFNQIRLDAGDWNWCPVLKDTDRRFECTKSISGSYVIEKIEEFSKTYCSDNKAIDAVKTAYDLGMIQVYEEIYGASKFVESLQIKNFMEIGTDQGGTFLIWSKLATDGIRISVDLPYGIYGTEEGKFDVALRDNYLASLGNNVHMIHGSSHDKTIKKKVSSILGNEKLDFLFIDGDHTYEGVKQDYEMYKEFVKPGGWIGFHDIKDTEFHRNVDCRVDILWNELTCNKKEFVNLKYNYGGIGFIQV